MDTNTSTPSHSSRHHLATSIHAKAQASRSFSEKVADSITARFGSMAFLILNIAWFAIWIAINNGLIPSAPIFDPFPFGLLTMIVSLEAIILSVIVLISQNRQAQVDRLREEIDLQVNILAEAEISKVIALLVRLLKKNGVDVSNDQEIQTMLKTTDIDQIEKALKSQIS